MAYPHGHARVNPRHPQAFAVCDRCGRWWNRVSLRWQYDYRGKGMQNLNLLVCEPCYDDPQPQLKLFVIPPDPLPVMNARIEPFAIDEAGTVMGSYNNDFSSDFGESETMSLNYNNDFNSDFG